MFIDKNSIVIEGVSFGQYISSVDYEYPKLWGDDTGRNLSGKFSGTLLRIAPKIVLHFHKLTTADLQVIAPILNKSFQSLQYQDPEKGVITITTYTGDWKINYKNMQGKCEPFDISFIDTGTR